MKALLANPAVRPARPDEAEALVRLSELAVAELCPRDYPGDVLRAARRVLRFDSALLDAGNVLVAELDGAAIGTASWTRTAPDGAVYASLPRGPHVAYLRGVFVHPNAAGRGIGTALVRACESAAHDAGAREIALGATFTSARLYARLGYRSLGNAEIALPGCSVPCVQMARTLVTRAAASRTGG